MLDDIVSPKDGSITHVAHVARAQQRARNNRSSGERSRVWQRECARLSVVASARDGCQSRLPDAGLSMNTSWMSSWLGPENISFGGRFLCASANAGLCVQSSKSWSVRHQVFTS